MAAWGAPGVPVEPTAPGTSGTVKAAVGLTMLAIALALAEAVLAVYMRQQIKSTEHMSADDAQSMSLVFGGLIGANLITSAGLAGGAILTLRRSVAGKVLTWVFGALSLFLRFGCGGFAGIFIYLYTQTDEENDSPFSVGMWSVLFSIEVIALVAILLAMVLLMLKSASFKNPRPPGGPAAPGSAGPPGYGSPYGSPVGRADGLPDLPPSPGWPT
jgi:hypothetical protein